MLSRYLWLGCFIALCGAITPVYASSVNEPLEEPILEQLCLEELRSVKLKVEAQILRKQILDLAAQSEVELSTVLEMVQDELGQQQAELVFRDWLLISRDLEETRKIAEYWLTVDPENNWARELAQSQVTGTYFLRLEPSYGSVVIGHGLVEMFGFREGTDFVEAAVSVKVDGELISKFRFEFPTVSYPHNLEVCLPEMTEGMEISAISSFRVSDLDGNETSHTLTQTFRLVTQLDGTLGVQPLGVDGSPVDPRAVEVDDAFRALQSTLRMRRNLTQELEGAKIDHEGISSPLIGNPAPELLLVEWDHDGDNILGDAGVLDLKGEVTLLDFWAVWCGPCIVAFPKLSDLHLEYEGLRVVSVCFTKTDRDHLGAEAYADMHKHMFAKGSNESFEAFGVRAFPTLVLVDKDGVVRWVGAGPTSLPPPELIQELLK